MVAVLAIDSGSQSTKVSVVDEVGRVHATARVPLRPYELGPGGRAVHPDDDLWDALTVATREALASYDGAAGEVVAVGLCGIRFCRALLDAEGRLVEPVLSWMDTRVAQPVGEDPRVVTVTSAGGYLATRLTGVRRDSRASHQGVLPPERLMPELVEPGGLLGRVTPGAAEATGVPAGLPVHATANDKAVEALGGGLVGPGTVLLSLGTYVTAMTVADHAPEPADGRYWLNDAAVPGRRLVESDGIRRGMWTVSWLRRLVSAAAPDPVDPDAVESWLEDGARDVPPGAGGLLTVPDWLAPGHAPHRRGMVVGLDGSHGPHHLHRSILEGIALTMRRHVEGMEAALALPPARLVVSGGGARSDLMTQVVADVFGRPAGRPAVVDAAAVGAAICAAVGQGVHPSFEAAVAAMVHPGDPCRPDPVAHATYDALVTVHAELGEAVDPVLRRLAGGRDG
ncbi:FGGY-family carbohydrate kinase [Nocardioides sp. GXQ0305]|uniref:FGGY-family carbohydrate kinase n=1 Tax=Nocardioides sp. GXQ0305 TaxID=3423912 RepID=UPI003D7CF944